MDHVLPQELVCAVILNGYSKADPCDPPIIAAASSDVAKCGVFMSVLFLGEGQVFLLMISSRIH